MRGSSSGWTVLCLSIVFSAGCLAADPPGLDVPPAAPHITSHVLDGAAEPDFASGAAFDLLGAVARTGPVYGGGEPSVWVDLAGTFWLTFPGCDTGPYLVPVPGQPSCGHGIIFVSDDEGATWTRLNDDATGRLSDDGPAANGDADIAVDAAGAVYASNLGSGIQVLRSTDRGDTWQHIGNVVPEDHWADRQWMAAGAPGHLIMTWMGGDDQDECARCVAVNTTFDGGENWTGVQYLGEDIGWLGTVQFAVDDRVAYVPFTQADGAEWDLLLARTFDGGTTWDVVDTGVRTHSYGPFQQWSGVLMAPAMDVTGDGTIIYAWAEELPGPGGLVSDGAAVRFTASTDRGGDWSEPVTLSDETTGIMPWVTGGAGDRFAVTYFSSPLGLDSDYVGTWDVQARFVDGTGPDASVAAFQVDPDVHIGGLCARGGGCLTSGSDRALLDFFESDLTPDGRLVVVYPADPLQDGKYIEIRVAVQQADGQMLERPVDA